MSLPPAAGAASRAPAVVRRRLVGANSSPSITGQEERRGKVHHLLGNNPAQWRRDVRTFDKVRYDAVYPGIDLIYYGNQSQLEFDFLVAAGADPSAIQLEFTGAERTELNEGGDMVLHTAAGALLQRRPVAYQEIAGARRPVECATASSARIASSSRSALMTTPIPS